MRIYGVYFCHFLAGVFTFITFMISQMVYAEHVTVFDVRKTVALKSNEKVYRDFYLNGGTEIGMKPGMVVTVTRKITPYDSYQNKSPGDLLVPVGELVIILAQKGVSVAREFSLFSRDKLPMLEYDYIMVGDRLDLATVHMQKGSAKGKSASTQEPPAAVAPVAAPAVEAPAKPLTESADFASKAPPQPASIANAAQVSQGPQPTPNLDVPNLQ